MKLFVEDSRDFPPVGYQCCRSAENAKLMLSVMKFEAVSLDYSLGTDKETGLDILIWMKENGISVPEIIIHSNNVIGKEKMREYAERNFPESVVEINTRPK